MLQCDGLKLAEEVFAIVGGFVKETVGSLMFHIYHLLDGRPVVTLFIIVSPSVYLSWATEAKSHDLRSRGCANGNEQGNGKSKKS